MEGFLQTQRQTISTKAYGASVISLFMVYNDTRQAHVSKLENKTYN